MCGILGFLGDYDEKSFSSSLTMMSHRGPDDQGVWKNSQVILGHRRLSIHDLSDAGAQPMLSECSRYVIVFNGEIYNYKEIKKYLNSKFDLSWKGDSDTEVLLNLIILEGVDYALKFIEGMFSFCFYDNDQDMAIIARDRFGEKPLFYYKRGNDFAFSSELVPLESLVKCKLSLNRESISKYIKYGYIAAPSTIFNEVNKIEPGSYAIYQKGTLKFSKYYKSKDPKAIHDDSSSGDIADDVKRLLLTSIEEKMSSDVPLGAFLSGGVDSSLIAAVMQSKSEKAIKTFTIGFDVEGYNEAEFAKEVSNYLGTEHFERYVTADMALKKVQDLTDIIDEPISDPSIIPTLFVSELARKEVTVSLCGDGADEVFAGYKRYFLALTLWNKIKYIPRPFRSVICVTIRNTPTIVLNKFGVFNRYVKKYGRDHNKIGSKLKKLSDYIDSRSFEDLYDRLISHTSSNDRVVIGVPDVKVKYKSGNNDYINFMMQHDQNNYLVGDLLAKLDTATMHYSLEGRAPFLDSRLVDYVNSLPSSVKVKNGKSKVLLKNLLSEFIPEEMFDRPKLGFGVPIDYWLRNDLKSWMLSSLEISKLESYDFFESKTILRWIKEHLNEDRNNGQKIWNVIILIMWLDNKSKVLDFEK